MNKGAGLIVKTVKAVESGRYNEHPQSTLLSEDTELRRAPKIFKDDCKINWNQPVTWAYNFIRGLSPAPAALKFATQDGFISVTDVQLEGKKRMEVAEFLRGVKL